MRIRVIVLLVFGVLPVFGQMEVLSKGPHSESVVEGFVGKGGVGVVTLKKGNKEVWSHALGFGDPQSCSFAWSARSGKVAISVRATKWSSEVKVLDVTKGGVELVMPDMRSLVKGLHSGVEGRYQNVEPVGWVDGDTLILRCSGNLVEGGSDGMVDFNYSYQVTVHVPTSRVVSVICGSAHDVRKLLGEKKVGGK